MNILYAVHHFPPNYMGGAELRAKRTAFFMQKRGNSVTVFCIEKISFGEKSEVIVKEDMFENLRVFRLEAQFAIAPVMLGHLYRNAPVKKALSSILEVIKPDLMHLIGGYLLNADALQTARVKGIPSIVSLTDFWYLCPSIQLIQSDGKICPLPIQSWKCARCLGETKRRYRWIGKIFPGLMDFYWKKQTKIVEDLENRSEILIGELNQAGVVISPSKFLRDVYIGEGVDPQKIIFSRQGVDLSIFPTTIPPKPKSEILRVGYIGQIVNIKGVHLVIEAIKKRPQLPIRLDIYGDLTDFPKYVEKIRASAQNDARIHIRGKIEHKNLFQVMENIDVLVVPSIWYENSPNIIQETFATHTPVITSNLGGMAELIEHQKNGLLFDPGDSDSLAEQIQLFIDSPGLGEKLAQGIQPVKSVEAEMDELETLYKQVIR